MITARRVRLGAGVVLLPYSVVIAMLTLRPAAEQRHALTLLDRVATRVSGERLEWSQTEVLANIALFIPAGFLLKILLGRVWVAIVVCVAASAGIELLQYVFLPSRLPTVDDVRHNGLGGAIGTLLAWPLTTWLRSSEL